MVNQEPVIVKCPGTITWTVPWGSNVRFADNGITVDAFVKPLPTRDGRPQPRPVTRDTSRASLFKREPTRREPSSPALERESVGRSVGYDEATERARRWLAATRP